MAFEFAILIYRAQSSHARQLFIKVEGGAGHCCPFPKKYAKFGGGWLKKRGQHYEFIFGKQQILLFF